MPSKRRLAPVIGKDGLRGDSSREHEVAAIEIDSTFGKILGLTEGQKVCSMRSCLLLMILMVIGWAICSPRSSSSTYNQY